MAPTDAGHEGDAARPPRILVLVLSIDREPWRTIELQGQRRTWAAEAVRPAGCEVVFYYGRHGPARYPARVAARLMRVDGATPVVRKASPGASLPARLLGRGGRAAVAWISERSAGRPCRVAGDRLYCDVPEVYMLTLPKLLAALRAGVAGAWGEFDYVYRTNTSSYVNLDRLQAVAAALPRAGCYAGWIVKRPLDGLPFVTGAGILMSRDVARRFSERRDWNWGTIDDGALGEAAAGMGLAPIRLERVLVRDVEAARRLTAEELQAAFSFRCKSTNRRDHEVMLAIHRRLHEEPA